MIGELGLPQSRAAHVLLAIDPVVVRPLILQKKLVQGLIASGIIVESLLEADVQGLGVQLLGDRIAYGGSVDPQQGSQEGA